MDMSNRGLALILIGSILISAGGTLTAMLKLDQLHHQQIITAYATSAPLGVTNVTVTSQVQLTMIGSLINFRGGFANGSMCSLNSTSGGIVKGNCTTFTDANDSLVVQNDGNNNVTINISFAKTAATWIGGTNPEVRFEVFNNESNACPNFTSAGKQGTWTAIPTTATQSTRVCQGSSSLGRLAFDDTKDALSINLFVNVTPDADPDTSGEDNLTVTLTGSDADKDPSG